MAKAPPSGSDPEAGDDLDLGVVWRALVRRRLWIALPTLLAFVGAFLVVNLLTPRYTAETSVLLVSGENVYTRPATGQIAPSVEQIDEQAVQSEVQVIMSRDLAREVIQKLGLVGNPEFDPAGRVLGLQQRIMRWLGLSRDMSERPPEDRVLEAYYKRLLVYQLQKSRVVAIEFTSSDPDLAARAANTIAETYLDFQQGAKQRVARSASDWLAGTIEPLRRRVAEAEAKVEDFRARHGLLSGTNANVTLPSQQLTELSTQLAAARTARAEAEAKANLIRDMIASGRTFDIPDVANNEFIRRLIEQRINLRAQLALELRTLLPEHPRIKELNAQLADLESQIRQEAQRTVRSLENEARLAAARVDSLEKAIAAQTRVATAANESEVQLRALEREARTQREQLEAYLARYREAQARDAENAAPADARIVSRAVVPGTPSFPKKVPIILIVTMAAFVLAVAVIISAELLSGRAFVPAGAVARRDEPAPEPLAIPGPVEAQPSVEPAAEAAGPPPAAAAVAPEAEAKPDGAGPWSTALQPLLARLAGGKERGGRIFITEATGAAGAVALARAVALDRVREARTILLDLSDVAGGRRGLGDLVAGTASFTDVIGREAGTRLHVVSAGNGLADALTATADALVLPLLALDQTYDWVICAVPADLREVVAARMLASVDHVVLVADESEKAPATRGAFKALKRAGARDVVVVVPEADGPRAAA